MKGFIVGQETQIFLTPSEVAKRWKCTECTVKNYRDRGLLSYFQPVGSTMVRYLKVEIEDFEKKYTRSTEEVIKNRRIPEVQRKKPDILAASNKEWRV